MVLNLTETLALANKLGLELLIDGDEALLTSKRDGGVICRGSIDETNDIVSFSKSEAGIEYDSNEYNDILDIVVAEQQLERADVAPF